MPDMGTAPSQHPQDCEDEETEARGEEAVTAPLGCERSLSTSSLTPAGTGRPWAQVPGLRWAAVVQRHAGLWGAAMSPSVHVRGAECNRPCSVALGSPEAAQSPETPGLSGLSGPLSQPC